MKDLTKPKIPCWVTCLLSFLIPASLFLLVYAWQGVFPFGEKSMLFVDMNGQYVDFYAGLHDMLRGSESISYSLKASMGLNFIGVFAYYLASPLTLIAMLMPLEYLTEAIFIITILKIGLCGLSFSLFARFILKEQGLKNLLFSVCYALMAYNIVYASNLMWLDGVILLPVVIWGVERLLYGRPALFTVSLIILFIANYYISFMVGAFAFCWFICRLIIQPKEERNFGRKLCAFFKATLLAAGAAAFFLLPAFFALKNGQIGFGNSISKFETMFTWPEFFSKLVIGSYDTIQNGGAPNMYCSLITLLGLPVYLLNREIPKRERVAFGGLSLFLILCMYTNIGDWAWHAFKFPTWFPFRYSFVLSFLFICMALRGLQKLAGLQLGSLGIGYGLSLGVLLLVLWQKPQTLDSKQIGISILLLGFYGLAVYFCKTRPHWTRVITPLAALAVLLEMGGNTLLLSQGLEKEFGYHDRASYTNFILKYRPVAAEYNASGSELYRMELTAKRSDNDPLSLGYNGVSHYSTTTNQRLNRFLNQLGHQMGIINSTRYDRAGIVADAILGLRYVGSTQNLAEEGYREVGSAEGLTIYENPYALPVVYLGKARALELDSEDSDMFQLENQLYAAASGLEGQPVFEPATVKEELQNLKLEQKDGYLQYDRLDSNADSLLLLTIQNPSQKMAYLSLPVYDRRFSNAEVYVNGNFVRNYLNYMNHGILPLGRESTIQVTLKLTEQSMQVLPVQCYLLNEEALAAHTTHLQSGGITVTSQHSSRIEGSFPQNSANALLTSIPYDKGWRVEINGERVKTTRYLDVFLAASYSGEIREVKLQFVPMGSTAGLLITFVTIGGYGAWALWKNRKRKNTR